MIKIIKKGIWAIFKWYVENIEIRLFIIQHWPRYWSWYRLGYIDVNDEDDVVDLITSEFNATHKNAGIPKIVKWALS